MIRFRQRRGLPSISGSIRRSAVPVPAFRRSLHSSYRPGSCRTPRQIPYPDQVVCSQGKGHRPSNPRFPSMSRLAKYAHRLEPSKDFFDSFPFALTDHTAPAPAHFCTFSRRKRSCSSSSWSRLARARTVAFTMFCCVCVTDESDTD